jgi:hypothetical protein
MRERGVYAKQSGDFNPGGIGLAFQAVEIDLGGGQAGMAEEGRDLVEVISGLLAQHGGGVAQGVDSYLCGI